MTTEEQLLAYGKICWLWSNSSLHNDWTVNLQTRFVIPPVFLGQYIIIEDSGMPMAYCSWAMINQDVEKNYILRTTSIKPEDWNSGDRLWVIDWVSPFSVRYTHALKQALNERFPRKIARAIRVKKGDNKARIAIFTGSELSKAEARIIKDRYYEETVSELKKVRPIVNVR